MPNAAPAVADAGFLPADWPAPANVRAGTTTRVGGVSAGAWQSFNLADHVGDDAGAVAANRERLRRSLALPAEPCWLRQVHGTRVVAADAGNLGAEADAVHTSRAGVVCAVLTADCLPVLLCDRAGSAVAAVHAGWRGLADGILDAAVEAIGAEPSTLLAWLGPAIGPAAFEVGDEVRAAFVDRDPAQAAAFTAAGDGRRYDADLYALARRQLAAAGVTAVHGGGRCTFSEAETFYSYRRDGACGRMASMIWMTGNR